MKLVIGVPTKNRQACWYRGLLVDSLAAQTDQDFELVICDDDSRDRTQTAIRDVLRPAPFPVRLYRLNRPQTLPIQDSALADNVLFADAIAHDRQLFLHLDDDGYAHPKLVALARSWPVTESFYGRIMSVNPKTLELIGDDPRIGHSPLPVNRCGPASAAGALWRASVSQIADMGGHDMTGIEHRAGDSRFGFRLASQTKCSFLTSPEATFFHLGHTTWRKIQQGRYPADWEKLYHSPNLGHGKPAMIANGGRDFWRTKFADYRLVWSNRFSLTTRL